MGAILDARELRQENREREMPWTALVDAPPAAGRQVRSVGACVAAGPGCATGPCASPGGQVRASQRVRGRATAAPTGVCRGRLPGRGTGDMVARWPCLTRVSVAAGPRPRVPRAPRIFRVLEPCPHVDEGPSGEAAVLRLPHLCHHRPRASASLWRPRSVRDRRCCITCVCRLLRVRFPDAAAAAHDHARRTRLNCEESST